MTAYQILPRSQLAYGRKIYWRGQSPRLIPQTVVERAIDQRTRELSHHEGGHAVVTCALQQPLWRVMIDPATGSGACWGREPRSGIPEFDIEVFDAVCRDWKEAGTAHGSEEWIADEATILCAGGAAQRLVNAQADQRSWASDYEKVAMLAELVCTTPQAAGQLPCASGSGQRRLWCDIALRLLPSLPRSSRN
jgi:hypothetical protein